MADVLLDRNDDGVALVTLNRPDSLNAMGGTLMQELGDTLAARARRGRAVVASPVPDAASVPVATWADSRSAGRGQRREGQRPSRLSIREAARPSRGAGAQRERSGGVQRRTSLKLHTMPKPTVALVNGAAAGAG